MLTAPRRRAAFTLVEMLVVITIIAVLVGLTATAVLGVRINMQKGFSESTLVKIDQKLHQKQQQLTEQIRDDLEKHQDAPDVQKVMAACDGNKDMARAILLYARMRRDLPMTFAEAYRPEPNNYFTVCGFRYYHSPAFKQFAALPATPPNTVPADINESIEQSAACLYAAIAGSGLEGLEQQIGTGPRTGQKVFIDGFGTPIAFVRIGFDGNQGELNKLAFDPFYPVKNTQTPGYRNLAANTDYGANFNAHVWNVVRPTVSWLNMPPPPMPKPGYTQGNTPATYPGAKNHTSFVFSAGVNRQWIDDPTVTNSIYDGDNLFSYRLRKEGNQGD